MLVLTRQPGQTIHIGDEITVTIVAIRGGQVRLGIDAHKSCHVVRGELMADQRSDRKPTDIRECD